MKRAFHMKSKAFFIVFERLSFGEKNKKWQTQALRTSYKELISCTNQPNAHIHTFPTLFIHWSFI